MVGIQAARIMGFPSGTLVSTCQGGGELSLLNIGPPVSAVGPLLINSYCPVFSDSDMEKLHHEFR